MVQSHQKKLAPSMK